MDLQAVNICKTYRSRNRIVNALKGVSFDIREGEHVLLAGESGAGKTSLLRILALIDPQYEGSLYIDGTDMKLAKSSHIAALRNNNLGYTFQEYALLESESIWENIRIPLLYSAVPFSQHKKRIRDMLDVLRLDIDFAEKVRNISGDKDSAWRWREP